MEKHIVLSNKLTGKGTNTTLREEALRVSNNNRAVIDFNKYVTDTIKETEEEIIPSIPDFLIRIQDQRRIARRRSR